MRHCGYNYMLFSRRVFLAIYRYVQGRRNPQNGDYRPTDLSVIYRNVNKKRPKTSMEKSFANL